MNELIFLYQNSITNIPEYLWVKKINKTEFCLILEEINAFNYFLTKEVISVKYNIQSKSESIQKKKRNFQKILNINYAITNILFYLDSIREKYVDFYTKIDLVVDSLENTNNIWKKDTVINDYLWSLSKINDKYINENLKELRFFLRMPIDEKYRNSEYVYLNNISEKNFQLNKEYFNEKNFFKIDSLLYKSLKKETKAYFKNNRSIFFNDIDMQNALQDDVLKNNLKFKKWYNKLTNGDLSSLINPIEDKIIYLNKLSNFLYEKDYISNKIKQNNIINNVGKNALFLESYLVHSVKKYNFEEQTALDRFSAFLSELKIAEATFNNEFVKIKNLKRNIVLDRVLKKIEKELSIKFENIKTINKNSSESSLYTVIYKNKKHNLYINFNNDDSVFVQKTANYKSVYGGTFFINVNEENSNIFYNKFSIKSYSDLCHELGHFLNTLCSNGRGLTEIKLDEIEMPSIFLEKYFLQRDIFEEVINKKLTDEQWLLMKNYKNKEEDFFMYRYALKNYITSVLFLKCEKKGDINKIEKILSKKLNSIKIKWSNEIYLLILSDIENLKSEIKFFSYEELSYVYLLGEIVAKNMLKKQISLKKAFTNLFNYDMIKIDQCYWSKYVDF